MPHQFVVSPRSSDSEHIALARVLPHDVRRDRDRSEAVVAARRVAAEREQPDGRRLVVGLERRRRVDPAGVRRLRRRGGLGNRGRGRPGRRGRARRLGIAAGHRVGPDADRDSTTSTPERQEDRAASARPALADRGPTASSRRVEPRAARCDPRRHWCSVPARLLGSPLAMGDCRFAGAHVGDTPPARRRGDDDGMSDDELPLELGPVSNGETAPAPVLADAAGDGAAGPRARSTARRAGAGWRGATSCARRWRPPPSSFALEACSSESRRRSLRRAAERPRGRDRRPRRGARDARRRRVRHGRADPLPRARPRRAVRRPRLPAVVVRRRPTRGSATRSTATSRRCSCRSDTNIAVRERDPGRRRRRSALAGADGRRPPRRRHAVRRRPDPHARSGDPAARRTSTAQLDAMNDARRRVPDRGLEAVHAPPGSPAGSSTTTTRRAPQVGKAFLERARETGVQARSRCTRVSPAEDEYASPVDIGPAAAANPDLRFVVYHSRLRDPGRAKAPYDPAGAGVDRLVASLDGDRHRAGRERLRRARLDVVPRPCATPTRPRTCSASCSSRSGPITSSGAPTRSGTARRRPRSRRSARSRSRPSTRSGSATPRSTPEVKRKILGANAARALRRRPDHVSVRLHAATSSTEVRAALPATARVLRAAHAGRGCRPHARARLGRDVANGPLARLGVRPVWSSAWWHARSRRSGAWACPAGCATSRRHLARRSVAAARCTTGTHGSSRRSARRRPAR